MRNIIIVLLISTAFSAAQDLTFYVDSNQVENQQFYSLLPKSFSVQCNNPGWKVSRIRIHVLNGRWPLAKMDLDTNAFSFGITADSTQKLMGYRKVLLEALEMRHSSGRVRLIDKFVSLDMDRCLKVSRISFALVTYNDDTLDLRQGLDIVKGAGNVSLSLSADQENVNLNNTQTTFVRGRRGLRSFRGRDLSEEHLQALIPGDRIYMSYGNNDGAWENGVENVMVIDVNSSEYYPGVTLPAKNNVCL